MVNITVTAETAKLRSLPNWHCFITVEGFTPRQEWSLELPELLPGGRIPKGVLWGPKGLPGFSPTGRAVRG